MNRLRKVFENGKAFIPFITAGDPSIETTEKLVYGMAEAGADLIELGIPFSDPVAKGNVIQAAKQPRFVGRSYNRYLVFNGKTNPQDMSGAHSLYDLCQSGILLWI